MLLAFQNRMDWLARWSVVIVLFAAPTSRALFNVAALLVLVGWFAAGRYRSRWLSVRHNPILWPCLLLSALILIGIPYSSAPTHDIVEHLRVYSKLLFVLMVISLMDSEAWRRRAWIAFIAAMLLILASTYANVWWELPWSKTRNQGLGADHSVFTDYIVQGVVTSFFVALSLYLMGSSVSRAAQVFWALVSIAAIASVIFLVQGRTGQLTLIASTLTFVFFTLPRRIKLIGGLACLLLLALFLWSSPLVVSRWTTALSEFQSFIQPHYQYDASSSIGIRLRLWQISLELMQVHPIWGHGTGAYHALAATYFSDCTWTCFHPHNQFLFFGVQHGLLGIAAYIFLFWGLIRGAQMMPERERVVMYAFVAVFFVNSIFNAPLWYRMESYIFYSLIGLLMAGSLGLVNRPAPAAPAAQSAPS